MEQELQTKLVEILTILQSSVGKSSDFVLSQMPDIVQSYVLYGRITYTLPLLLWVSLIVLSLYLLFSRGAFSGEKNVDTMYISTIGGVFGTFLFTMLFLVDFPKVTLVWFAPKVWLLKEFASIINSYK